MFIGISLSLTGGRRAGTSQLRLSATTIPEDAEVGDTVGTLSVSGNYTGTPAFTLEDDADGLFSLDGSDIKVAGALDFETAEFHDIQVSVADIDPLPSVNPRTIRIAVTNVISAPTLTLTSGATDNQPDFLVENADATEIPVGATITVYAYTDESLTTLEDSGSGVVAEAGTITITDQLGPLTDGDKWFVARSQIAGQAQSANSNVETITIDATAPTITSANTADYDENDTAAVITLTANEAVSWSVVGGADQALFEIQNSDKLHFIDPPDFEDPQDANTDNDYVVTVRATDTAGNTTNQTITVTVKDTVDSTPTAWNSADKNANIVLTNSDLTVGTAAGAGPYGVRSTASATGSQKIYFEIVVDATGSNVQIGVATSTKPLNEAYGFGGSPSKSAGVWASFNETYRDVDSGDNGAQALTAIAGVGDNCSIAVDVANAKIWFRLNGGNWNNSGAANPATNTGGYAISFAGPLFALAIIDGAADQLTGKFDAASWTYEAPSGFSQL